jgi:hypothetical protein
LARPDLPHLIHWSNERKKLAEFLTTAPFKVDLNANISDLAAGQKQKVEILKQLYLQHLRARLSSIVLTNTGTTISRQNSWTHRLLLECSHFN